MHFSLLSKSGSNKYALVIKALTWVCRITVGCVFIISGFVKAIDPWGSLYKFEEYVAAMGIPMLHTLLLTGVFALCALEFLIGVFSLLGCYRRSCPVVGLVFISAMLILTLWIAIFDPVSDCGCFGDFIHLSNWSTFWKNVVLTIMMIWLVRYNRTAVTVISPAFQWMAFVISLLFITVIAMQGYLRQPFADFRPYKTGSNIVSLSDTDDETEVDFRFVYEKNGERREFGINDDLPSEDDGWIFVERIDIMPHNSTSAPSSQDHSFRLWSRNGETDMTDEIMSSHNQMFLLLIPDLSSVSPATTWKINELYDWGAQHDTEMIAVVSGTTNQIAEWEDLSMPQYEIYTCDDTAIKEVARGNPAVVYVENNRIIWKSTLGALDIDLVSEQGEKIMPADLATDGQREMINLIYLFMACLAVPVTLSMLPRIKNAYSGRRCRRKPVIRDDKAPHGE